MKTLIDRDELYKALAQWDWQDLYLPVHFKELVDELPAVGGGYTEQEVRDSYNDGFSTGSQRGYEDAVHNYARMVLKLWTPVSERSPQKDDRYLVTRHDHVTNTEFIDLLWYEKNLWWDRRSTGDYAVTAWMPQPDPWNGEGNAK